MPALQKATLTEIAADERGTPVEGTEIAVQFNPASLKLQLANALESQDTRAQQTRQYLGKTSTTLSFDLYFDTADEGTTDAPVSVRGRTAAVERFVLPKGEGRQKERPPKVRFHWKELTIDGVIEDVAIDFDLFAADGTPLRAKLGVVIREQDAKYQLGQTGPGANRAAGATLPGRGGAGPGSGASSGTGGGARAPRGDSVAVALAGESAAEFGARMGLDPAAWRGVAAAGGGSPLSLPAGAEIAFDSALTASSGVGVAVGADVGATAPLEATFGLAPRETPPTPAAAALGAGASAGFALAAAGGVQAAVETVRATRATQAADGTRAAFAAGTAPIAPTTVAPRPPEQSRLPLARTGMPSAAAPAPSAPAPPMADARATTFGFGVPLRDRLAIPRTGQGTPRVDADPAAAPWTRLRTCGGR